jgi:hypothetical protein
MTVRGDPGMMLRNYDHEVLTARHELNPRDTDLSFHLWFRFAPDALISR